MDPRSILDQGAGDAPAPPEPEQHESPGTRNGPEAAPDEVRFPAEDGGKSLAEMARRDLNATLQLLAERAQYITGASGAAIALRDREGMVCRASAGSSSPEVGAQLQINSGLSGESVRTRQTLRCHDAYTDERVNRESCEALGIRSVVVMPLLQGEQVIGVFELFSDKANIFEARDITALERMGAMVHTALENSATQEFSAPAEATPAASEARSLEHGDDQAGETRATDPRLASKQPEEGIPSVTPIPDLATASVDQAAVPAAGPTMRGITFHMKMPSSGAAVNAPAVAESEVAPPVPLKTSETNDELDILEMPSEMDTRKDANVEGDGFAPPEDILGEELAPAMVAGSKADPASPAPSPPELPTAATAPEEAPAPAAGSRGGLANLRKCQACGFPVSEGRQLCLDCEKKARTADPAATTPGITTPAPGVAGMHSSATSTVPAQTPVGDDGEMPQFLSGEAEEESWLARHRMMVATVLVAVVAIVAAFLLR